MRSLRRKNKFIVLFLAVALAAALLCGCGTPAVEFAGEKVKADVTDITMVLQSGETAMLDSLPELKTADLSGSTCLEEITQWAEEHPQVAVTYTVPLPSGETVKNDATTVDLSALSGGDAEAAAQALSFLPKLKLVELGTERSGLGWEDIKLLTDACPQADFNYSFTLYGMDFRLADARMDLNHIQIDDGGALVSQVVACMPNLHTLDMDSCGVADEDMAAIRDANPEVKVIWRVWFGDNYSVRTDVERILASKPTVGGALVEGNYDSLKYCTDVKYLDVGHNETMPNIDFVAYMPKLEVGIFAMAIWSDASPLANCKELEYLELQTTNLDDLTPLSGLTKLKHLNICHCYNVTDISPLYSLTQLERLWIGCLDPVPEEQIAEMQAAAPDCMINTTAYDPTEGLWRYDDFNEWTYQFLPCDRYEELREQFDYYADSAFSYSWNDPLY